MVIPEYEIMPNFKFRTLQNSEIVPNTETKMQAGHKTQQDDTDFLTYTAPPNPLFQSFFS